MDWWSIVNASRKKPIMEEGEIKHIGINSGNKDVWEMETFLLFFCLHKIIISNYQGYLKGLMTRFKFEVHENIMIISFHVVWNTALSTHMHIVNGLSTPRDPLLFEIYIRRSTSIVLRTHFEWLDVHESSLNILLKNNHLLTLIRTIFLKNNRSYTFYDKRSMSRLTVEPFLFLLMWPCRLGQMN